MKKLLIAYSVIAALAGCTGAEDGGTKSLFPKTDPKPPVGITSQLETFSDGDELQKYLVGLKNNLPEGDGDPVTADASPYLNSGDNEEITNNQESGVDEGGLVKNYKDYLVILRRGRLVSVRVGDNPDLAKIDEEAVTPTGLNNRVWYDELLVHQNEVIVIGYRWGAITDYQSGATELNFFRISESGQLTRTATYLIESGDYYSGTNYSGRLVKDQLVFYTPFSPRWFLDQQDRLRLPKVYSYVNGQMQSLGSLLNPQDVVRPMHQSYWPTLHTIVTCDLESTQGLDCQGKAILGGWSRKYYVSSTKAYLWVDAEHQAYPCSTTLTDPSCVFFENAPESSNLLYAVELDGSGSGVTKVQGRPLNQFSFSETEEGLSVFAISNAPLTVPCARGTITTNGAKNLLIEIPSSAFDAEPTDIDSEDYTCLPNHAAYEVRFSPTNLVYGANQELTVVHRNTRRTTHLTLPFDYLERLELAGDAMLAIGSETMEAFGNSQSLVMNVIRLNNTPNLGASFHLLGAVQGEYRSHGYAFHTGDSFGTFGLATQAYRFTGFCQGGVCYDGEELVPMIQFFHVNSEGMITEAGTMERQNFTQPSESCTTSCIDWYGDDRPIFLQDRVLGLIGDQITAGEINPQGLVNAEQNLNIFTGERL